jgi:hypothetical protein
MSMPLGALPHALTTPGMVRFRSDKRLAEDVDEWLKSESPLRAHPVAEVHAAGVLDDVKPMALLQGLGRATSSLPPLCVPGAATMVGLSALLASSQWAVLKYLWAFDTADPRLRLSEITDYVRSHQRSVFSE